MSSVLEELYTALTSHTDVAALVGTRVYPHRRPPKAGLPAVTYFRVSNPQAETHSGSATLAYPRVQLNCLASTPAGAEALARAVKAALGSLPAVVVGGGDLPGDALDIYGVYVDATVYTHEV